MKDITRRRILRGALGGGVATLGLPLFDCLLNTNGTAFASGAPLPLRFGNWYWGCGMFPERWIPQTTGADFEFPVELKPLEKYRSYITILSGHKVMLDGAPNTPHVAGVQALRTGDVERRPGESNLPSNDVVISDAIGQHTRFRSLEVTASGLKTQTFSRRNASTINYAEISPVALYTRIFGPDFQDPNNAHFTPDPRVMVHKSVITGVQDDVKQLAKYLGASDKERLDQYLTAVRELENQLAIRLEKPAPAVACSIPEKLKEEAPIGADIDDVHVNNKLMANLLAMAMACNQTKVFNMNFNENSSSLRRKGWASTHHTLSHEEPLDPEVGTYPMQAWFNVQCMEGLAEFIGIMASFKEGDGSLLDNMHMHCHSDLSMARYHQLDNLPIVFAGKAGGRLKMGLHVSCDGEPVTRTVLTSLQVMGLPVGKYGTRSMETTKPITEIMA